MQLIVLGCSKTGFSETNFFDIFGIDNVQISYLPLVLDPHYVSWTVLWCLDEGKGLKHDVLM